MSLVSVGCSLRVLAAFDALGAVLGCVDCESDRGLRRAKAEALMIMYFHVVNCLWLLGWFGDVLSCLGCMLLCIFVLKSFSRCSRPRARFVELIRCSRPWACFVELIRRFPFSAAQVWGRLPAPFTWGNLCIFRCLHGGKQAATWGICSIYMGETWRKALGSLLAAVAVFFGHS